MSHHLNPDTVIRLAQWGYTPDTVSGYYRGENGGCCCGCSGTHVKAHSIPGSPASQALASEVWNTVASASIDELEPGDNHVARVLGPLVFILYLPD